MSNISSLNKSISNQNDGMIVKIEGTKWFQHD